MRPCGVVLAHPSGNRFFRELAAALHRAGRLSELCTAIDWQGGGIMGSLLPRRLRSELERRSFSRELGVRVATHPWREAGRLAAARLGWHPLVRHEKGAFSVDAVYRDFDAWVARRLPRTAEAGIAYAYEDAAEATFAAAGRLGWQRVYDLPIAYWETSRRLLDEEAERWPAWEPTLVGTRDSAIKQARKARELAQADLVVCPSRFVADSVPSSMRKRVVVAPFGSPPAGAPRAPRDPRQPLRVLFAGSLSQRKGLADLFAAMRLLRRSDIELVVFGSPVAEMSFYRRELASFTYEPPRPHAQVLKLMRTCDVLCLPSIVEGRALVVQEAMSMGLPAVITANTGADDVVVEGESGFVVPVRAPASIAEKLAWLADHRDGTAAAGEAARQASARFSWADYGAKIVSALAD